MYYVWTNNILNYYILADIKVPQKLPPNRTVNTV